jgi:hypothetical protein
MRCGNGREKDHPLRSVPALRAGGFALLGSPERKKASPTFIVAVHNGPWRGATGN